MKDKHVVFVGPVNRGEVPTGGQIAKCQSIVDYFDETGIYYTLIDSYNRNKFKTFCEVLLESVKKRDCHFLLLLGSKSALYLSLGLMLTFSLKRTGYLIVGNWFPKFLSKYRFLKYVYNKFLFLSIEGKRTADVLKNLGLTRIVPLPNFKRIYDLTLGNERDILAKNDIIKVLFLARVCKDKGVDIAIEAIRMLNMSLEINNSIALDIYGKIDETYEEEFRKNLHNIDNINYKGLIDLSSSEGYELLAKEEYYLMVFPTEYVGEGFAGTFIDGMILGLPVVASDWNLNSEVIVNSRHGIILKNNNAEELMYSILDLIKSPNDRNRMAREQYQRKNLFNVDNVMSRILEFFDENLAKR